MVEIPQVELERKPGVNVPTTYTVNGKVVMAGQEWYDKFINAWERTKKRWLDDRDKQGVIEAAKKATGIDTLYR